MKTYGGSGFIDPHFFLPRNWLEVSGQLHAFGRFTPGACVRYGTHHRSKLHFNRTHIIHYIYDPGTTKGVSKDCLHISDV
jgi:hypothetical protein